MISLNLRKILGILTSRERRELAKLMTLDLVISIADILFLAALLFMIRTYSGGNGTADRAGVSPVGFAPLIFQRSVWPILVFFLLFSAKNLAGFLVYKAQCRYLYRVASRISGNKLLRYLEGDWSGYVDTDSAVQIRQISYQPLEFAQHVLGGVQQIITQVILIALTITAILFFNAQLFLLLLLILLPPVFAVFYLVKRRSGLVGRHARSSGEKALQHLQEALAGYVESNIYDRNAVFLQRYTRDQDQFNRHIADHSIVQGIPSRMIEIFALLGIVLLIVISRMSGNTDSHSLITLGVFMAAAYKIIPGIVKILNLSGQINTYAFTMDSLAPELPNVPVSPESPTVTARPAASAAPITPDPVRSISFNNVRFSYGDRLILQDRNFCLQPGDLAGIAGASGKGKTTILHLLLGFLQPHTGDILINGRPTSAKERQLYWPTIAYVKQQPFLIHDTILQNITLNGGSPDDHKLQEVINISGLAAIMHSFPDKLHTIVAENGKNISGGQRQRIAIARALYKDADCIILDEPFSELDETAERALLDHCKQLAAKGKLVILITHNSKSLSYCNKIISLDESHS